MMILAAVIGMAIPALASGNEKNQIEGILAAVDVAASTVTVNAQTYSVSAQVIVEVGDTHISFDQLIQYLNQRVELKLDSSNIVVKIEVKIKVAAQEIKGTLTAVDAANRMITVNNKQFAVSAQAKIEIKNQGRISLDQLSQFIGLPVQLKLDASNTAVKIEVKGSSKSKPKSALNSTASVVSLALFDLSGKRVFQSDKLANSTVGSLLSNALGSRAIHNGVYLAVIFVRDSDGTLRSQVKKLVIAR